MNRRSFLYAAGGVVVGVGGYKYANSEGYDIPDLEAVGNATGMDISPSNESDPTKHTFGFLTSNFESIKWTGSLTVEITFPDDHQLDGFGIRPPGGDELQDNLITQEAPEFGGVVEVDLLSRIVRESANPGTYRLIGYEGEFGAMVNLVENEVESAKFSVQPEIDIWEVAVDGERVELAVENSGDAPFYAREFVVDREASIGSVVPPGSEVLLQPDGTPFRTEDNCTTVPTRAEGMLRGYPRLTARASFETGLESEERRCTITMG